jgi:hypothetical protein
MWQLIHSTLCGLKPGRDGPVHRAGPPIAGARDFIRLLPKSSFSPFEAYPLSPFQGYPRQPDHSPIADKPISGQLSCCPSSAQAPEGVDRWSGASRSRDPARARHPCTTAHKRTTGHEWRVALELIAQSSPCMRRKLFLYSALPMAFPRRSPAT